MNEDTRTILSKHFLFSGLDTEGIEDILKLAKEKCYSGHHFIFRKGDKGHYMMLILEGRVRISVSSADGKEIILNLLEPGEILGEMALIDGEARCADAITESASTTRLLLIYRDDFLIYLKKRPGVAIEFLKVLCKKLRQTSDLAESISLLSISCRLARLLIRFADHHGQQTTQGIHIHLKMSQQEIGYLISATRESVNINLRKWETQGLIVLNPHAITIIDRDTLNSIAHATPLL